MRPLDDVRTLHLFGVATMCRFCGRGGAHAGTGGQLGPPNMQVRFRKAPVKIRLGRSSSSRTRACHRSVGRRRLLASAFGDYPVKL